MVINTAFLIPPLKVTTTINTDPNILRQWSPLRQRERALFMTLIDLGSGHKTGHKYGVVTQLVINTVWSHNWS